MPVYDDKYFKNRRSDREARRRRAIQKMSHIFTWDLVRSDFLLFDPLYDFKFTPMDVTPINRYRKIITVQKRSRARKQLRKTWIFETPPKTSGPPGYQPYQLMAVTESRLETALTAQSVISGFLADTSKRTRTPESTQGEFEMFIPQLYSAPQSYAWVHQKNSTSGNTLAWGNSPYKTDHVRMRFNSVPTARVTQLGVDSLLTLERARMNDNKETNALRLVARALPNSRSFNALREIGELRDLPRTIKGSLEAVRDLGLGRGVDVPSAFLNKEFGWDPLFDSLLKLVRMPERIARRVNWLMSRNGLPTTLYSGFRETLEPQSTNILLFDSAFDESALVGNQLLLRDTEWRVAVNQLVKFPRVDLPKLKETLTRNMWGLRLRPSDLYDLMPWSWLIDWFTGLGDYIDCFSAVNENTSIINYGFLTYVSRGRLIASYKGTVPWSMSTQFNNNPPTTVSGTNPTQQVAVLRYKYQNRVDLSTLQSKYKSTSKLGELPGFEASILGALLLRGRS